MIRWAETYIRATTRYLEGHKIIRLSGITPVDDAQVIWELEWPVEYFEKITSADHYLLQILRGDILHNVEYFLKRHTQRFDNRREK